MFPEQIMSKVTTIIMTAIFLASTGISAWAKSERPEPVSNKVLIEAENLLLNNQTQQAYQLLDNASDELTGDAKFDYLYGLAALRVGKPGFAIFALERAVAQEPGSGIYLLDLGRAYFEAQDFNQAKETFSRVIALSPPVEISNVIYQYMDIIDARTKPKHFMFGASMTVAGGNDTNVNNATSSDTIQLHNVLFYLNEQSQQQASTFQNIGFDAELSYSPRKRFSLFGISSISQAFYPEASFVDTSRISSGGGFKYISQKFQSQNYISIQRTDVNKQVNSYVAYAVSDQQWNISNKLSFALFAHGGQSKLPRFAVQDAQIATGGSRISYRINKSFLSVSGFASWNLPESAISPYANRSAGMQASFKRQTGKYSLLYIDSLAKYTDYYRGYIGLNREDALGRVSMGIKFMPTTKWSVSPDFSYTRTKSTIDLFEYDKLKVSVSIQRQLI